MAATVESAVKPTVADHIARFLVDRGVEQVFGLCGHTNISRARRVRAPRGAALHRRLATSRSRRTPPTGLRARPAGPAWCSSTSVRA